MVAPTLSLICQTDEERSDGGERIGVRLEASKLGMVAVALGSADKDFLGEQSLSPCGDQAFRVKESWMHSP